MGDEHVMVTPDDLKWQDVPSLPAGAKMAVIEGPPTQAVPFTSASSSPRVTRSVHGIGPWGVTYVNPADDPLKK